MSKPNYLQWCRRAIITASLIIFIQPAFSYIEEFTPTNPGVRMDTVDQNWNVFGGLGYASYFSGPKNDTFQVTPNPNAEYDRLSTSMQEGHLQYLLGFQRVYLVNHSFVQRLGIGSTIFYDPTKFTGQVYQYQDVTENNFNYTYRVRPINIDAELQILFPRAMSANGTAAGFYSVFGVGFSAINLSYSETPNAPISCGARSFNRNVFTPLLVAGLGIQVDTAFKYLMRVEYRFVYRGTEDPNGPFLSPVSINLNTQSINVMVGRRFA